MLKNQSNSLFLVIILLLATMIFLINKNSTATTKAEPNHDLAKVLNAIKADSGISELEIVFE